MRSILAMIAAGALALALPVLAAGRSPRVPGTVADAISKAAPSASYAPTYMPPGYRYAKWTNVAVGGPPSEGGEWFTIEFRRGSARLTWTVSVADPFYRCSDLSVGYLTIARRKVYWGTPGRDGQDAWTCLRAHGRSLMVDAFDHANHLEIGVLAVVAANWQLV